MTNKDPRVELTERVVRDFTYQPPRSDRRIQAHEAWGQACMDLALYAVDNLPLGRHLSLTLTALEEVRMRGNQSIALDSEDGQ